MSRSLMFLLETKLPWRQTPSRKKKAVVFTTVTTDAYLDQLNAGVTNVCEIFKVCSIESLKYVREFHTVIVCKCTVIVATFPRPETWRWTKQTVIGCLTCRSNGLIGWPLPTMAVMSSIPDLQLLIWRSGYARLQRTWLGLHTFKHRLRKPGKDCTICDSWENSGSRKQSWKRSIQGP